MKIIKINKTPQVNKVHKLSQSTMVNEEEKKTENTYTVRAMLKDLLKWKSLYR